MRRHPHDRRRALSAVSAPAAVEEVPDRAPGAETLYFRPENFWREQGVTLDLGVRGRRRSTAPRKRVALSDGREVASARWCSRPGRARGRAGAGRRSCPACSRAPDRRCASACAGRSMRRKRVVIVGGGYIGLEVAAVARGEGRDVTVLEAEDRVMKRVTSPVISGVHAGLPSRARRRHPARRAARGDRRGRAGRRSVRLADGTSCPADLVLVAVGAQAE